MFFIWLNKDTIRVHHNSRKGIYKRCKKYSVFGEFRILYWSELTTTLLLI